MRKYLRKIAKHNMQKRDIKTGGNTNFASKWKTFIVVGKEGK